MFVETASVEEETERIEGITLERLRILRHRAERLLKLLPSDLLAFRHTKPENGFVRSPNSSHDANDVNVTTTGSCLMSLALSGRLTDFYLGDRKTAAAIFAKMLDAPWMSSGLSENNAFTTTLVLRTLGFLVQNGHVEGKLATKAGMKPWESGLTITNLSGLLRKLNSGANPLAEAFASLMSDSVRDEMRSFSKRAKREPAPHAVSREIARLIRSSVLYDKGRFKQSKLRAATLALANGPRHQYWAPQINRLLVNDLFRAEIAPLEAFSLSGMARTLAGDPNQFRINDYAASPVIIYWFVDAIDRAGISLSRNEWGVLCGWAAQEFAHQRSLVVAKNAVMMDPVAMAMAACLCVRLRSISHAGRHGMSSSHQAVLPSVPELNQSILELFDEQTDSGIWPKYFALFHYQEAGSNFCFTFELLEAVLTEFGEQTGLMNHVAFIRGLEKAITWCEQNRLEYVKKSGAGVVKFCGWNSGGFLESLKKEQPESWATAVVHMFLWELVETLSDYIQSRVLEKYEAGTPTAPTLADVLDIDVLLAGTNYSLKGIIEDSFINPFKEKTRRELLIEPPRGTPVSALLFGPPGTSKTQIARMIAHELDWPLVQIDPSHFLKDTFQHIYIQAEHIFDDIEDLTGVVVFFDEMDALVQNRDPVSDAPKLDTESQFLTTFMLPKLARLHDLRHVIFLMATNFQERFDDAIKRAGRFDLLLCVGPPTLAEKCASLHVFYGPKETKTTESIAAGQKLQQLCASDDWLHDQLQLYTFGEFNSFLHGLSPTKKGLGAVINSLTTKNLRKRVEVDASTATLRMNDLVTTMKDNKTKTLAELDTKDIEFPRRLETYALRYIRDRKVSKRQA
jgi:hypothetical protein